MVIHSVYILNPIIVKGVIFSLEKLNTELKPKNHKNVRRKNNLLAIDSSNQVESSLNLDENIV
jgi:hypothetical protein